MKRPIPLLLIFCSAWIASCLLAQTEGHGVTPEQLQRGEQLFLSNCTACHGGTGDAVPGVNLASGRFRRATTDNELVEIVRRGIPGTPMPPGSYTEEQAGLLVAWLRSMNKGITAATSTLIGDAARGKGLVSGKGQCLGCHRVNGNGAFLGPDLSEVGATRRTVQLERALLDPNGEIRNENQTVQAITREGASLKGRLLNYDTYSVQMIDATGKLLSLNKADLAQFEIMRVSAMPTYTGKLTAQEVADVVAYLASLKGDR
jgi:putative heme-binding domain-containing protein